MSVSINMLVIIIIMIAMLGFGLSLFSKIFKHSTKMSEDLRQSEIEKLNYLLDDNRLVTVLDPQKKYEGKPVTFAVGISNVGGSDSDNFKIEIIQQGTCNYKFESNSNTPLSNPCVNDLVAYDSQNFVIKNNDRAYKLIAVDPSVASNRHGFYVIKFKVKKNNQDYGSVQTIWVNVD